MATATEETPMMIRTDAKDGMLLSRISDFDPLNSGYPSEDQLCLLSALPWISRCFCANNIFGLDSQESGFRPEETAFISLKIKLEHEFNLAYCVAQGPYQSAERMTDKA